jgi:hypothetical protein
LLSDDDDEHDNGIVRARAEDPETIAYLAEMLVDQLRGNPGNAQEQARASLIELGALALAVVERYVGERRRTSPFRRRVYEVLQSIRLDIDTKKNLARLEELCERTGGWLSYG